MTEKDPILDGNLQKAIIVDQIVDHFLPLDMNEEAQLTLVLGTWHKSWRLREEPNISWAPKSFPYLEET